MINYVEEMRRSAKTFRTEAARARNPAEALHFEEVAKGNDEIAEHIERLEALIVKPWAEFEIQLDGDGAIGHITLVRIAPSVSVDDIPHLEEIAEHVATAEGFDLATMWELPVRAWLDTEAADQYGQQYVIGKVEGLTEASDGWREVPK